MFTGESKFGRAAPAGGTGIGPVDTVVKFGGGVLQDAEHFGAVVAAIAAAAVERRLLVVGGGGPFADTVRRIDLRFRLPDETAHWMAVLAMDQYAHLLAARIAGAVLVARPREISDALTTTAPRKIPVLAPYRWLRETDPLPHAWTVTSDSIAAWVAGAVGARRLVLIKPAGASGDDLVDGHFSRALPPTVTCAIVPASSLCALRSALRA